MNQVKFSVFADLHHYPGVFYSEALERLDKIRLRAIEKKVDCIISLGDFCHNPQRFAEIVQAWKAMPMPAWHVLGNHDTDCCAALEAQHYYDMPGDYYYFDLRGFRFIILNTNYYRWNNGFTRFEFRNYFDFPETRETLPPEQLQWLEATLMSSSLPCLIMSHASLERDNGGVQNAVAVRQIIARANYHGHRVLLCINGHHHRNHLRLLEQVAYLDLNSSSFDWLDHPHNLYPEEFFCRYELANHQIIYNDPIHAIITVREDGWIYIEGMCSSVKYGISREMTANPHYDSAGRPCEANVLSAQFQLC